MKAPAYPAAHIAAARIRHYFETEMVVAGEDATMDLPPYPEAACIEAVIDAAFWASLQREEGHTPRISIAWVPPEQTIRPLFFEQPIAMESAALTRLGPAVEGPGIHLGASDNGGTVEIWGITHTIPRYCFVLEVVAPGLLVVKHRRGEESDKYINVAVLEGDRIKVLNQHAADLPGCPALLSSLLGFNSPSSTSGEVSVLVRLAIAMRAHGRGGLLLVVRGNKTSWRESILSPIPYPISPPYTELADLMREDPEERLQRRWQEALVRSIDAIAGLTAVDGATIITEQYDLLAFGAKIARRDGRSQVEQVVMTEPIEGTVCNVAHASQIGGTRHQSAAQFALDQKDSVALVASQDGRFTLFAWSPSEQMVHAHRVESLLL